MYFAIGIANSAPHS